MEILPLLSASITALLLGFLWYQPQLFGVSHSNSSLDTSNLSKNMLRFGAKLLLFSLLFVGMIELIHNHTKEEMDFIHGFYHGSMIGLVFIAGPLAILTIQQGKEWKPYLIDATYLVLALALGSGVLGVFH